MPGPQELIVIVIVALLVFGPDRLPELARKGAKLLAQVRNEASRNVRELREATEIAELERELRQVQDDYRGTRSQLRDAAKGSARSPVNSSRETPALPKQRAQDEPPPTDPEAT